MRTFILSSIVLISIIISLDDNVCPTPATIHPESEWELCSIYEITISDGCPRLKDKEVLLSVPLIEAINIIQCDDNTSYGDYCIEYKYIEGEDLYVANIRDEFIEL